MFGPRPIQGDLRATTCPKGFNVTICQTIFHGARLVRGSGMGHNFLMGGRCLAISVMPDERNLMYAKWQRAAWKMEIRRHKQDTF